MVSGDGGGIAVWNYEVSANDQQPKRTDASQLNLSNLLLEIGGL